MNFLGRNKNDQQPAPFDVSNLEAGLLSQAIEYAPPATTTVESIGKITADAMAAQYEMIATELTALASETVDLVRRIEKLKIDADEGASYLLDTAEIYRKAGRAAAESVEQTAQMIDEVRATCEALRKRVQA